MSNESLTRFSALTIFFKSSLFKQVVALVMIFTFVTFGNAEEYSDRPAAIAVDPDQSNAPLRAPQNDPSMTNSNLGQEINGANENIAAQKAKKKKKRKKKKGKKAKKRLRRNLKSDKVADNMKDDSGTTGKT